MPACLAHSWLGPDSLRAGASQPPFPTGSPQPSFLHAARPAPPHCPLGWGLVCVAQTEVRPRARTFERGIVYAVSTSLFGLTTACGFGGGSEKGVVIFCSFFRTSFSVFTLPQVPLGNVLVTGPSVQIFHGILYCFLSPCTPDLPKVTGDSAGGGPRRNVPSGMELASFVLR